MPKNCDNCKYDLFRLCGEEDKTPCDDCYNGNPPTKWEPGENYEPKTNADRIRSMTDEKFAKALTDECLERESCYGCFAYRDDGHCPGASISAWMEWLQAPAEGE
jgi:hypothetical protein